MGWQLFKSNQSTDSNQGGNHRLGKKHATIEVREGDYADPPNPHWRNRAMYSLLNPLTTTHLKPVEFKSVGPLSRWLSNVSIRWVITVPFIVQMVLATTVVGYLSFRHGQATTGVLLEAWQTEMGDRIRQHLDDSLQDPKTIVQLNQQAYESGWLEVEDMDQMRHTFHQQLVLSDRVSYLNFTDVDGHFMGVGRDDDGSFYAEEISPAALGQRQKYRLDANGDRTQLRSTSMDDPRTGEGYRAAVAAGEPIWSELSQRPDQPESYVISVNYPIYQDPRNPDTLVGVLGADFALSHLNQFLADVVADTPGQIFIMERSTGGLIASAFPTPPFTKVNGEIVPIQAIASDQPLIRETATYLATDLDGLNFMSSPQSIQATLGSDRHYLRLIPWSDQQGLDWLIVSVIPQATTSAQINHNTVITLILCGVALAIAIGISIRTAQWIIQPILFLNNAAKNLARGAWNQTFVLQRSDEVGELAQSFNDMARQLRHSFRDLEQQKDSFARFFPPEYLDVLDKKDIHSIRLGDHVSREMPVMFSDIRGFTSLSENMTPRETFSLVNDYLAEVAPAVRTHDGLIIKFLGDGTMAVFPYSADSAINAGIDTFHALDIYNRRRISQGETPIHIGIGLHVGYMMVGIIGEQHRMQADAISDTVNLTARLEGLTKFYGVSFLITGQVVENLSDPSHYQLRFLGEAIVKGRREPISIYEVIDVEEESDRHLKQQTLTDFNDGVRFYRDGTLTAAKAAFERVIAVHPHDKPAQCFLHQIDDYLSVGQPHDWNGIWRFTSK